jgi:alpha/beta superfamily hydrolase
LFLILFSFGAFCSMQWAQEHARGLIIGAAAVGSAIAIGGGKRAFAFLSVLINLCAQVCTIYGVQTNTQMPKCSQQLMLAGR